MSLLLKQHRFTQGPQTSVRRPHVVDCVVTSDIHSMFILDCPSAWLWVSIVKNPDAPSKCWKEDRWLVNSGYIQYGNLKVFITWSDTAWVHYFGGYGYDDAPTSKDNPLCWALNLVWKCLLVCLSGRLTIRSQFFETSQVKMSTPYPEIFCTLYKFVPLSDFHYNQAHSPKTTIFPWTSHE